MSNDNTTQVGSINYDPDMSHNNFTIARNGVEHGGGEITLKNGQYVVHPHSLDLSADDGNDLRTLLSKLNQGEAG